MKKILSLAAMAMCFMAASGAHAATILDGDFTNTNATYATVNNGSTFGPWSVTSGSIDLIGGYWTSPSATPNAGSVDLDGNSPGSISQVFVATPGSYVLNFSLSGNPDGTPTTKALQVDVGGTIQDFTYTLTGANSRSNMLYTPESLSFTSGGGPITLSFLSLDTGTPFGPVVGNVSVSAVPLPASLLLFGTGLVGLLMVARRKAARA